MRLRREPSLDDAHLFRNERNLTGNKDVARVDRYALAVRSNVGRCPVRQALHVHRVALADVISSTSSDDVKLCDDVKGKVDSDADAHRRIETEVTSVDRVDASEVAHVLDTDVNRHEV